MTPKFNPWPEPILGWLSEAISPPQMDLARKELLTNGDLAGVATKLAAMPDYAEESYGAYEGLRNFLECVIGASATFDFADDPDKHPVNALPALERACNQFLNAMANDGGIVELYLAGWPNGLPKEGRLRRAELIKYVETIRKHARAGDHVLAPADIP